MVRVNSDNTIELDLDNRRAPLVFVVAGRKDEAAQFVGRSIFICPEDANNLSVALAAVGEAEQERRGGHV